MYWLSVGCKGRAKIAVEIRAERSRAEQSGAAKNIFPSFTTCRKNSFANPRSVLQRAKKSLCNKSQFRTFFLTHRFIKIRPSHFSPFGGCLIINISISPMSDPSRRSQDRFLRPKIERFFWRDFSGEELLPENSFLGQKIRSILSNQVIS